MPLTLQPEFCGLVCVLSFELLLLLELLSAFDVEVAVWFEVVVFPAEFDAPPLLVVVGLELDVFVPPVLLPPLLVVVLPVLSDDELPLPPLLPSLEELDAAPAAELPLLPSFDEFPLPFVEELELPLPFVEEFELTLISFGPAASPPARAGRA